MALPIVFNGETPNLHWARLQSAEYKIKKDDGVPAPIELSAPVACAAGSPSDDEVGGEDERDKLVMIDRSQCERRGVWRATTRQLCGMEIHHPVGLGH